MDDSAATTKPPLDHQQPDVTTPLKFDQTSDEDSLVTAPPVCRGRNYTLRKLWKVKTESFLDGCVQYRSSPASSSL